MENIVYLSKSNYKDYLPIDIVAFSYAEGGAMGCGGEIIIISSKKKRYSLNYLCDYWTDEDLYSIVPPLKDCIFYLGKYQVPDGWLGRNLECGNYLAVKNTIRHQFLKQTKGIYNPGCLYREWEEIILSILDEYSTSG